MGINSEKSISTRIISEMLYKHEDQTKCTGPSLSSLLLASCLSPSDEDDVNMVKRIIAFNEEI